MLFRKEEPVAKKLPKLEERLYNGAESNQVPVARENLPQVIQEQEEVDRRSAEISQDWIQENTQWEGSPAVDRQAEDDCQEQPAPEPARRDDDARLVRWFSTCAWVALFLELLSAAYVAQFWVAGRPLFAVFVGLLFAVVYTVIAKFAWLTGRQDHTNPAPEFKRRERILWWWAVLGLSLLGSLLITRFIEVPDIVYTLQLTGLSAVLPIFAGGAFALADWKSTRNRLAARYWALRAYSRRLQTLIDRMKEVLGLSVLLFLLSAGSLHARTVQVWLDVSGSAESGISASAYATLSSIVVRGKGVERIEVFGFADGLDALRMPAVVIGLPRVPRAEACAGAGDGKLGFLKLAVDRDTHECEERQGRAIEARQAKLAPYIPQLVRELRTLEQRKSSLSTCFFSVVNRSLSQGPGTVSVILSDGAQESCDMPPRPSALGARVVVILVPRKGDGEHATRLLEERSRKIRQHASGVIVVPLFRMESELPNLINK